MKQALHILLLMLLLALGCGAGRGLDTAVPPQAGVAPAAIGAGECLQLFSYNFLGVEVRSFTDEEFEAFYTQLAPYPKGRSYSYVPGKPAALYSKRKTGLIITRVIPGSPAEKGGLEVGDIFHTIGGASMDKPEDLLCVMRNDTPGTPMHMWLIDKDLRWKRAQPCSVERPEPVAVGHIVTRRLCDHHQQVMQQFQAKVIELLAMEKVPVADACDALESVCRIVYQGRYTPGCLRVPLRSGACSITATRNGWDIDVVMVDEKGVVTKGKLRRWIITQQIDRYGRRKVLDGPDRLPEPIRQRLLEMDTREAAQVPVNQN